MRCLLSIFAVVVLPFFGYAQLSSVVSAEYFFDSDPGVGSATALSAFAASQNIDVTFLAASSGLAQGMHTLGIRVRDNNNMWSIPGYLPIFVLANSSTIAGAEYFFDTDPGSGNGVPIPMTTAATIDLTFAANSAALPVGMHIMGVRTRNPNGNWSIPSFLPLFIDQSRTITKLEYFFDTDPGSGNGIIIPVSPPTDLLDQVIAMNSSALAIGGHTVNVRVAGQNNFWSIPETATFNITAASPPTITSFTPTSGPIGTTVTITGTNFSATPANNIVYFGATRASVTAAASTQLTVTVPAGATYQPISVLVNGLTAFSSKPFTVTFSDGGIIDACSFAVKVDVTTGSKPYSVAIGDLDADGKPDLAVANETSNTVSVYKNISALGSLTSSSFAAKVDFVTGAEPYFVTIQDMDGDGKPELIVTNNDADNVSIYKNNTSSGVINSGSFAAKVDFSTGENPWNAAIADFDLDGKPDLAIVNDVGNSVSILKNTSTVGIINATSFAPKVDFATGNFPIGIASGDLDRDGKYDIVTTNQTDNSISVLRNTSTAGIINASSFAAKIDFAAGLDPYSVTIGDLDANDKPEVIVANYSSGTASIYNNTSTSGSITLSAKVDFNSGASSLMVALSDMDGDGKIDLTVSNGGNHISVLKNLNSVAPINGSSFSPPVDFLATNVPYGLAIGDLDGNGKPDIAAANSSGTTASLLQNTVSSLPLFTSSGFSPTTGPVGTAVTFTGTNFSTTPLNNTIKFNGVTALVTASSSTSITAIVPMGATTGPVSIQIGCITAISIFPFTVTAGSSIAITTQPADLNVCINDIASFTTSATGTTNITYQWQFSPNTGTFSDINNGSSFSGVTTATLSVNTANSFGAGQYRCRINGDLATQVITNSATLSITNCGNNQPPVIVSETTSVLIEGVVTIDLVPLISDPDDNLNLQSLQLVNTVSEAGASASISTSFELTLDYGGVLFSGTDFITISVCDLLNDCIEQELSIEVAGDIIVYNAISPNSDDKNEILYLKYIDVIPEKQNNIVSIYNRWGSKVFEVDNYNNDDRVFKGLSDNGNELPSGTYFYKIVFTNIDPNNPENERTGYLVLKR